MDRLPLFRSGSVMATNTPSSENMGSEQSSINTIDLEKAALRDSMESDNESEGESVTYELPDNPKRWSLRRRIFFYLFMFGLPATFIVSLVLSLQWIIPVATDPESYKWGVTQIDENITPPASSNNIPIPHPTKSQDILCSKRWRMILARVTIAVWTSVTSAAILALFLRGMSEFISLGASACRKKGMTLTWADIRARRKTWERRYWFYSSWLLWTWVAFCIVLYSGWDCVGLHDKYGYIW